MHANTPESRAVDAADELRRRAAVAAEHGAWLTYGMGTENQNLPGFVAMCPGLPVADVSNWRSALPAGHLSGHATSTPARRPPRTLIENIRNAGRHPADQRRQLDLLAELNRHHQQPRGRGRPARGADPVVRAGLPDADRRPPTPSTSASEPQHVRELYGPGVQARQLLIARRLVERGVRFVQLFHGDVQPWDSHDNIARHHRSLGQQMRPGRSPRC